MVSKRGGGGLAGRMKEEWILGRPLVRPSVGRVTSLTRTRLGETAAAAGAWQFKKE